MEVIVIESEAFKAIMFEVSEGRRVSEAYWRLSTERAEDKWLSPKQAAEYTGFKQAWIVDRKERIGFFQDGNGLRFKKSKLDKYMDANSVEPRTK